MSFAPLGKVFVSLRQRNFRLLWTGTLISHTGDWLDQIALSWLVLEQTGSAFYLGLVNLCRGLPLLVLTLVGGAVADRMERRKLLMITQSLSMVLAIGLALITSVGISPLWAIMALATMRGCVLAFNLPARHSLIPELVPREVLPNAIALNSMTLNMTKIIGPVLAGMIIAAWGTTICFAINAISFIAVLWTLAVMRFPPAVVKSRGAEQEGLFRSIGAGMGFVASNKIILLLVLIALLPTFLAQPYIQLLPVFAHQVFEHGALGLGMLTASAAFGSVLGGLLIAGSGSLSRSGLAMILFLGGFGVVMMLFAFNHIFWIACVLLTVMGALFMAYNTTHATLLQLLVPTEFRGRVLSVLFLNRGLVSMGTASAAAIASLWGVQISFIVMAALILLFAAALLSMTDTIRRLKG